MAPIHTDFFIGGTPAPVRPESELRGTSHYFLQGLGGLAVPRTGMLEAKGVRANCAGGGERFLRVFRALRGGHAPHVPWGHGPYRWTSCGASRPRARRSRSYLEETRMGRTGAQPSNWKNLWIKKLSPEGNHRLVGQIH